MENTDTNVPEINWAEFEEHFTAAEKMYAFGYHLYQVILGGIVDPEKQKKYIALFNDFVEYQKKKQSAESK